MITYSREGTQRVCAAQCKSQCAEGHSLLFFLFVCLFWGEGLFLVFALSLFLLLMLFLIEVSQCSPG